MIPFICSFMGFERRQGHSYSYRRKLQNAQVVVVNSGVLARFHLRMLSSTYMSMFSSKISGVPKICVLFHIYIICIKLFIKINKKICVNCAKSIGRKFKRQNIKLRKDYNNKTII